MDTNRIVAEIDAEISRLQTARAALAGIGSTSTGSSISSAAPVKGRRGRPKGSKNVAKAGATAAAPAKKAKRRNLSPEGRKAIADAMKRRWAERRKQAAK